MRRMLRLSMVSVALTLVYAVLPQVGSASSGGSEGIGTDPGGASEVTYLMDSYGIDRAEAESRLEAQQDMPTLMALAMRDYGDSFAGGWIDHHEGGAFVLAFTAMPPGVRDLAAHSRQPDRLSFREGAQHTLTELYETFDDLGLRAAALRGAGQTAFGVQLDSPANVVNIFPERRDGIAQSDSRAAALQSIGDGGHESRTRIVDREYSAASDTCTRTSCDPPMRGATELEIAGGGLCSIGFVANESPQPPAGNFYAFTAGHCGAVGTDMAADTPSNGANQYIGPVVRSTDTGPVDAAIVWVVPDALNPDNAGVDFWAPSRWVYHDAGAEALQIHGKITQALAAAPGIVVCRSGRTTLDCGAIVASMAAPNPVAAFFGLGNWGLLETDMCGAGGDSGGPVYTRTSNGGIPQGTAFALHSQSNDDGVCTATEHSYATHISAAERQHGVLVWCAALCNEEL